MTSSRKSTACNNDIKQQESNGCVTLFFVVIGLLGKKATRLSGLLYCSVIIPQWQGKANGNKKAPI